MFSTDYLHNFQKLVQFPEFLYSLSHFCSFWVDPHSHAPSVTSWADNCACSLAFHSDIFVSLRLPFLPEITDPAGIYPSLLLSISSKFICVGSKSFFIKIPTETFFSLFNCEFLAGEQYRSTQVGWHRLSQKQQQSGKQDHFSLQAHSPAELIV